MKEKIIIKGEFNYFIFLKVSLVINLLVAFSLFEVLEDGWWAALLGAIGITFWEWVISTFLFVRTELVVTDERVYGKTLFGTSINLPFDSISSVAKTNILKKIRIATSSGTVKFSCVQNNVKVYDEINKVLRERQNGESKRETKKETLVSASAADELKKYKELLDMGAISEDEYAKKKKELLNL